MAKGVRRSHRCTSLPVWTSERGANWLLHEQERCMSTHSTRLGAERYKRTMIVFCNVALSPLGFGLDYEPSLYISRSTHSGLSCFLLLLVSTLLAWLSPHLVGCVDHFTRPSSGTARRWRWRGYYFLWKEQS